MFSFITRVHTNYSNLTLLTRNKFETIPSAVGKLTNLRVLSLRGNVVKELSSTNLPKASIIWLILTNNKISKIDTNIGDVKLLRKLMLSHNMLDSIPVELGECKDLELIRLQYYINGSPHVTKVSMDLFIWESNVEVTIKYKEND